MNERRCPFPTIPSSSRHLSIPNLSTFEPSNLPTFNSLSPFPATLTDHSQIVENSATLSPVFATLTSRVTHKSFVCHSYRKHRGWGSHKRVERAFLPAASHPFHRPRAASHQSRITSHWFSRTVALPPAKC